MTTTPASHRRSLWGGSVSFFSPSNEPVDHCKFHRYSTLPAARPAASSLFEILQELGARPRAASKGSEDSLSKRTSFIDLDDDSPKRWDLSDNAILVSLKGRLNRKKSAPLPSDTFFSPTLPPMDSPTTPTGPGASQSALTWSSLSLTRDDTITLLSEKSGSPTRSYKDERKLTVVPGEVVDSVGYGFRESRRDDGRYVSDDVDVSRGGYHALPFTKRGRMLLHSYPRNEAPYMQGYNKVDLQNDVYFNLLLRRLNTTGMPSFHEYINPPQNVLDLGCGQGVWAQEAARAWAEGGTKVVGYDLVDLISKKAKSLPNVSWRRGNFVAYQLPFRSGTFDLVRLSNLTVAVPERRWEHVLVEVKRVLKPRGRVELIDDELLFSYPEQTPGYSGSAPNSGLCTARSSWSGSDGCTKGSSDNFSERHYHRDSFLDLDADQRSINSAPGLCRGDSPSEESCEYPPTPIECINDLATLVDSEEHGATQMSSAPLCREIEKIYETMLEGAYCVNTRPGSFLERLLRKVFGPAAGTKTIKDFQLFLLNPVMHELVVSTKCMKASQDIPRRAKRLFKVDRESRRAEKEKELIDKLAISQAQQMRKSKALKILGETNELPSPSVNTMSDEVDALGELSRASSSISSPNVMHPPSSPTSATQTQGRYRPTGLFLFPDQFLETTSHELEMYVCKHANTLISCKAALDEHVLKLRDDNGDRLVTEEEWHEMLWEYERSRHQRFNLPDVGGQFDDSDDEDEDPLDRLNEPAKYSRVVISPVAAAINNQSHTSSGSSSCSSCTRVRRIRVFEAYKVA